MELRYDEDLIEQAVFLYANRSTPGPPPIQLTRFHRERDKLYTILDPDDRNGAFFQCHLSWFREWDLERPLLRHLAEFPLLSQQLSTFAMRMARDRKDEAAELYVHEGILSTAGNHDSTQRTGVLAIRAPRLIDARALAPFARHEFTHLQDMLNPEFGYEADLFGHPKTNTPLRLTVERYRLLWDISIDGRISRAGWMPEASPEHHQAALARAFPFWPPQEQEHVFATLWQNLQPRHASIWQLAVDPRAIQQNQQPRPGAPCPLCEFTTFDWVLEPDIPEPLQRLIAGEFPAWSPVQGLCRRCLDAYGVAFLDQKSL